MFHVDYINYTNLFKKSMLYKNNRMKQKMRKK